MSPVRFKSIWIFIWITAKVAYGSRDLSCRFVCDDIDVANRFSCYIDDGWYSGYHEIEKFTSSLSRQVEQFLVYNTLDCSAVSAPMNMNVPAFVFEKFTYLKVFHMNNSDIVEVFDTDFQNANYLKNLSLAHNDIKELPPYLFKSSLKLQYLDLSFNAIKVISENAFELEQFNDYEIGLTFLQLRYLHLDNNLISHLEQKLFSSLKKLEILTLNNNLLWQVDGKALFGENFQLRNLYLNSNQLKKVQNFDMNYQFLNMSDNSKMDVNEFVINFERADISNTFINPLVIGERVRQLNASYSKINKVYTTNNNFTEFLLVDLDLAHNSLNSISNLTSFTNLVSLNLSYNSVEMVDKRIFERLVKLEFLNLAHNQLDELDSNFLHQSTLMSLDLSFNRLKLFKTNVSENPKLKFLNLAHNQLDEFDSNVLHQSNLVSLDLSYNRLRHFKNNSTTYTLLELNLAGNQLTAFDSSIYNIRHLRMVALNNNDWNCQYLARIILLLKTYNIRTETILFVALDNTRSFDSNVKGISCFTQSVNTKRKIQLKQEIETLIDQRLMAFELKMSELIQSFANKDE